MEWQAWAVLATMILVLVLLYSEVKTPDVILLGALVLLWNLGIVATENAIAGFSNASLLTVGALFIVVQGVDKSKLIDKAARRLLGSDTSERMALMRLMGFGLVFSGFFNNTPLVALLMPILRDWARSRGFAPSKFLIPLSYSTIGGGMTTIIGTSTNLVVQGMMQSSGMESFGFFDTALVGGPVALVATLYMLLIGYKLLPDNRGGLFRTMVEHNAEMFTELKVGADFPLVNAPVSTALDRLGIPQDALKKIFRQQKKADLTLQSFLSAAGSGCSDAEGVAGVELDLEAAQATGLERQTSSQSKSRTLERAKSHDSPKSERSLGDEAVVTLAPALTATQAMYRDRTQAYWPPHLGSDRTIDASPSPCRSADLGAKSELRLPANALDLERGVTFARQTSSPGGGGGVDRPPLEIFPVQSHEVLEAGDILVLSLPRDACLALVASPQVSSLLSESSEEGAYPKHSHGKPGQEAHGAERQLAICDVNFLDLPGRQNEFVELVLSRTNPFVGRSFDVETRRAFEECYQVAILADRASSQWERSATGTVAQQEPPASGSVGPASITRSKSSHTVFSHTLGELSVRSRKFDGGAETSLTVAGMGEVVPPPPTAGASIASMSRWRKLRQGDTILVLARTGEVYNRLEGSRDFLAITRVGQQGGGAAPLWDYVPLLLFIAALVIVALNVVEMVQASITLAILFVAGGWVHPKQIRECVDWNLMILIGSALGVSAAVQESGLSAEVAHLVKQANLGPWGSVYLLFIFTTVVTELVTNNAAAALAFPLAVDLTREMGLTSVKPLAMTVMLGASTSYASPIGYATNLMVLGPGGYTFGDFLKVGLPMDLIYWIGSCTLLPFIWPLETLE